MDDDPYMDGYIDGQSTIHELYDPALWNSRWVPPTKDRVPINIHPEARDRLHNVLMTDYRFHGMGYSQFIMMALDLLTQ